MENITIRTAALADVKTLEDFLEALGRYKDYEYFPRLIETQDEGDRLVLVGEAQGRIATYCVLNWKPKYALFQKLGFPEIQDLNVLPELRQRGIATHMIKHCEALAKMKNCDYMGIGVGLASSYGPAQKLYVKLGYIPDGNGINYDRQSIAFGEFRPVDDDLCLMMVKAL